MNKKSYIFDGKPLMQKHTGVTNCKGCFFEYQNKTFPCCEKIDGKFLFPCSKDIIYIDDDRPK